MKTKGGRRFVRSFTPVHHPLPSLPSLLLKQNEVPFLPSNLLYECSIRLEGSPAPVVPSLSRRTRVQLVGVDKPPRSSSLPSLLFFFFETLSFRPLRLSTSRLGGSSSSSFHSSRSVQVL